MMFTKLLDLTSALDFINCRPTPPNAYRVLFIGDSLTVVGTTKKVWDSYCGMAASSPENDFVHLVVSGLQEMHSQPVEALYNNGGNGKIREMLEYLQLRRLFPDLAIIQGGENDKFDVKFREYYPLLLDFYACPKVVLGDWYSAEKSAYEEALCLRRGLPFVNLFAIASDPKMSGNPGPYGRKDVASHPNDAGMAAIAAGVLAAIAIPAISSQINVEISRGAL